MNPENYNLSELSQDLITIRDHLRWAYSEFNKARLFYGHGTDNAWDEALYLVLSALHLPPEVSPDLMAANLTQTERRLLRDIIIRRLSERIPSAYLTHEAWFAGLPFYVDERVIIPRSPIAELIENDFNPWVNEGQVHRILDMCTGSGCIAIACALAFPESEVTAVDISAQALEVAIINVRRYGLDGRIDLVESDLFDKVSGTYDLIVSNPPYVSIDEYEALPHEYRHEPELALKAEEEGLELAIKIVSQAADYLSPEGILVVEVGNSQEAMINRFPQVPFLWLDFERGGHGVFMLTADLVREFQDLFKSG